MATVTAYLSCDGAADALAWYSKAFDAKELYRLEMPGGNVGHAEFMIGDTRLMLADEWPEGDILSPKKRGGATTSFGIEVGSTDELDSLWAQATGAGATVEREIADQFYGHRSGTLIDPFGHRWTITTQTEEVSPDEMKRRMEQEFGPS